LSIRQQLTQGLEAAIVGIITEVMIEIRSAEVPLHNNHLVDALNSLQQIDDMLGQLAQRGVQLPQVPINQVSNIKFGIKTKKNCFQQKY
jgi:hypothetical protein